MTTVAPTSLVIDARKLDRLSMDGPALKVVMRAKSPVLFPLRRLLRIHVIGAIDTGMDALLYCAERQIPVAFFHSKGRLRCQLHSPVAEGGAVSHWIEHLEFDPEARQVYTDWLLHQELHDLSRMGFNTGARGSRRKLVYEALRHACGRALGREKFHAALEWLWGLLHFHLEHVIAEYGLSSQHRGKRKLLEDMGPICQLWLLHGLAERLQRGPMQVSSQSMTGFYHEQAAFIDYTARRMLTQLVCRLEAIV